MSNTNADTTAVADALLTSRIEITFPVPMIFPKDWEQRLADLVNEVCEAYEDEHPDRVMWPAGFGSAPRWSKADAAFLGVEASQDAPESGEPTFDDTTFQISCAEREAYPEDIAARKKRRSHPTAATPASEGWQPIETAPKDETILLKFGDIYCTGRKRYGFLSEPRQDELWWRADCCGRIGSPTHWMLLPPAPQPEPQK